PTCASRRPRNLNRPSTARRATPATTGGSTTGSTITARTSRRAGRATRASAHAAGNPTTSDRRVDPMVTFSETTSAVHVPASASFDPACDQGARAASPATGTSTNATAGRANSTAHGARRDECATAIASGGAESEPVQHAHARTQHVPDELGGQRGVPAAVDDRDRIGGDHVQVARD